MKKDRSFPDPEKKLSIIKRYLHILALLQNNRDPQDWNGNTLANTLQLDEQSAALSDKAIRDYIHKHLIEELDIDFDLETGSRRIELSNPIPEEMLARIISVYSDFVVSDSTKDVVLKNFIKKHPLDCLWILGRIYFAKLSKNTIEFDYVTNTGYKINKCRFNPYHIILRNNNIYLLGRQIEQTEHWLLILNRVDNIKVTDAKFNDAIPPVDEIFEDTLGSFIGKKYDVKIEFTNDVLKPIEQFLSILDPEIIEIESGQKYAASFRVSDEIYLCKQLFMYGSNVEIISPPELRDQMKEMLKESLSIYEG